MISIINFTQNIKWISCFSGVPQGKISARDPKAGLFLACLKLALYSRYALNVNLLFCLKEDAIILSGSFSSINFNSRMSELCLDIIQQVKTCQVAGQHMCSAFEVFGSQRETRYRAVSHSFQALD